MTIRVLIADDHSVVRQGLRMFFSLDDDIEVVGEASDGAQAVHKARAMRPDLVLMDLLMPVMDGVAATRAIRAELPEVQVLALTSVLEDASVVDAVQAGAVGYLLKDTEGEALRAAVRAAAAGKVQLAPEAATRLVSHARGPVRPQEVLTPRETDVLRLLAEGHANKQIARRLGIGEKTVKTHVSHLLAKLGVQTRTQAALQAARLGLASDPVS